MDDIALVHIPPQFSFVTTSSGPNARVMRFAIRIYRVAQRKVSLPMKLDLSIKYQWSIIFGI